MKDFAAGLYISKAVEMIKCPFCKDGFADYILRDGGGHYYHCLECGDVVEISEISSENKEYCKYRRRIQLTQEDAEELFAFVLSVEGQQAQKLIKIIRERHRKAIHEGKE